MQLLERQLADMMGELGARDGSLGRNPLDLIDHDHAVHQRLCGALEKIADGLPEEVDRRLCEKVVTCLQYDLPLHHRDEDLALFPLLKARSQSNEGIHGILTNLSAEHAWDAASALEIAEVLEGLVREGRVSNPDMLGYMLRGFFESYRRHILWEDTLVMPLARQRLTVTDLDTLSQRMNHHRHAVGFLPSDTTTYYIR